MRWKTIFNLTKTIKISHFQTVAVAESGIVETSICAGEVIQKFETEAKISEMTSSTVKQEKSAEQVNSTVSEKENSMSETTNGECLTLLATRTFLMAKLTKP